MFPTFTGTSRRPRNVNLSGQRHVNPFAVHALSPSTGSAASKTVADAQAGRQKRQQERNELKAARSIQRVWRGHRVRRYVKSSHRQALAKLYSDPSALQSDARAVAAFPLLLASYDAQKNSDCQLLDHFVGDLVRTNYSPLTSGSLSPERLSSLAQILIASLTRNPTVDHRLDLLVRIVHMRPAVLLSTLGLYFSTLATLCAETVRPPNEALLVQSAVLAPLEPAMAVSSSFVRQAYSEFSLSFLTHPLGLLEQNVALFAQHIDFDALSRAVIESYSNSKQRPDRKPEELLWLLAHVIDLQRNQMGEIPSSPLYLRAICTQLSALANTIRVQLLSQGTSDTESPSPPDYLTAKIGSLADKDEISWLLDKFTSSQVDATRQDYASLLAGYSITLIRCFPDKADDIRMRLFLADFPTRSGAQPAVQFFWAASSATKLFDSILASPKGALDFLLRRKYFPASSSASADDSPWDREWRTVLLFLELYTFVMRLTDDEDFFSGFNKSAAAGHASVGASSSHVRASSLPLRALERLSLFLKNLAFTLNYNAAELLQGSGSDGAMQAGPGQRQHEQREPAGTYHVIAGVDFGAFKSLVTTSIQMLYERDSRRQFLPTGHWLMTTNFDMDGFLSAVVLEEQRQHDIEERGSDSESDDEMDLDDDTEEGGEQNLFASSRTQSRTARYAYLEKLRQQRKKSHRERMLATIGPKLEILRNMPYALPFELRVRIFRQFVDLDKQRRRKGHVDPDRWRLFMANQQMTAMSRDSNSEDVLGKHHARIRRNLLFETAYQQFFPLGEGLKEPIQITFLDEYGSEEAGIDGGGVTKEFLMSITKEMFTTEVGHLRQFVANKENALYPNPLALDQAKTWCREMHIEGQNHQDHIASILSQYEFTGRIVGKCMYEGILLDAVFAGFFLLKWSLSTSDSAYRASINDLREMDEDLYQGMLRLKNFRGDVSAMDLNFTLEDQVSLDGMPLRTETRKLIPNGDNILVTNENRPLYISYAARHRLVAQPYQVTKAFLRGLGMIIDPAWLRMFNQNELQRLVGGDSSEIDVADLRQNTVYAGVYEIGLDGQEHPSVQLFWKVLESLPDEDRRLVLKFVTSTPRAPLLGFSQLKPCFSIRDGGPDETRLPSASTCINLLKLPRYSNLETMRSKLLYAVRSNSRFDLS